MDTPWSEHCVANYTITTTAPVLYDRTNGYFEGSGQGNANAALGKSKERWSDCPLVTLALVLDASGYPSRLGRFAP